MSIIEITDKPKDKENHIVYFEDVKRRIIILNKKHIILDIDVAALYGVDVKDINKAVKNNIEKFPYDYMFELTADDLQIIQREHSSVSLQKCDNMPIAAFTEKGLYMLAAILNNRQVIDASFSIIETFTSIRKLKHRFVRLSDIFEPEMEEIKNEDVFYISYDGKEYPIREVFFDNFYTWVGTISLQDVLLTKDYEYTSQEAEAIDERIIFFVRDEEIHQSDEYILNILKENIE